MPDGNSSAKKNRRSGGNRPNDDWVAEKQNDLPKEAEEGAAETGAGRRSRPAATQRSAPPAGNRRFYRCPACGGLVDEQDHEQMTQHHQHVVFPRRH